VNIEESFSCVKVEWDKEMASGYDRLMVLLIDSLLDLSNVYSHYSLLNTHSCLFMVNSCVIVNRI